jgi:hypothetical protein
VVGEPMRVVVTCSGQGLNMLAEMFVAYALSFCLPVDPYLYNVPSCCAWPLVLDSLVWKLEAL